MVITVTTTSTTLKALMSNTQRKQAALNRKEGQPYDVTLQNPDGAKYIHFEVGTTATLTTSVIPIDYGELRIKLYDLAELNLISDTSNTDIMVSFN